MHGTNSMEPVRLGTVSAHIDAVPPRGTPKPGSRALWAVALIGGVGLIVRGLYCLETNRVPFVRHLVGDAPGYYEWAAKIAGGEWLGQESFYQAPLYPYVLAVWFRGFGEEVWGVRLVQAGWGVVAVWCLWFAGSRLFGRAAGMLAAIMLAVYAPAVFFDGIVQKTSLGGVLTCGLLASMGWCTDQRKWYAMALVGVVAGLLVLTRENALVWLPIVGLWVSLLRGCPKGPSITAGVEKSPGAESVLGRTQRRDGKRGTGWSALGWYVLGVAFVLAPVGVRNRAVGGEWSLSTFQAGANFYIGNQRDADGRYRPLVRGHETPAFERKDATRLAEEDLERKLTPRQVSHYWMSRAMRDIEAEPLRWLGLMGRKLLMVWNRYEVSDAESQYVYQEYSVILNVLGSVWHFGVLCPLAAVGVISTWNQRRRLWVYYALIVSMALAVALFYVMARYRFPLVPLLILFAAGGCVDVWRHVRSGAFRALVPPAVVALIAAGIVNQPVHDEQRLNAMAWMNVGVALAEEGDLAKAARYFQRAVEGHPASAEANNNLAQSLALQGDYARAIPYYRAALAAEPGLPGADYNLAVALEQVGRIDEALAYYERAVKIDPSDNEAREAIARLRERE